MKIINVEPLLFSSKYGDGNVLGQPLGVKTLGFVRVTTDNGLVGYGEAYCAIYVPEIFSEIIQHLKTFLLNEDPSDPEKLYDQVHIPFVMRSGLYQSAYSAVDLALWDIASQYKEKPIAELLSPNLKSDIKVYASGGSAAFSVEEVKSDLSMSLAQGHKHYKMRVGFQSWETDLKRVETAKSLLADDGALMVDAIMGTIKPSWDLEMAIKHASDLKKFGLTWLEEPLPPDNIEEYQKLTKVSPIDIAAGEALASKAELESYVLNKCVTILQPDVTHSGGITATARAIKFAKKYNIRVAMHVWGSKLAYKSNAAVAQAFDNVDWLEIPSVQLDFSKSMSQEKILVTNGLYHFKKDLGFGFNISNELCDAFAFVPGSGFRMPVKK